MTEHLSAPRLLAVDDDADSAELVARVAGRAGFEAEWECAPQRVAEAVARFAPDVLAMDLCMPDIDAIDLIDELRRGGFQGRLMIVSGQPDPLREAAARLAEIRGFDVVANVRKPVDVAGLRRRLFDVANDIGGTRIALVS